MDSLKSLLIGWSLKPVIYLMILIIVIISILAIGHFIKSWHRKKNEEITLQRQQLMLLQELITLQKKQNELLDEISFKTNL